MVFKVICTSLLLLHGRAAIDIVQQSKSAFHKAILNNGSTPNKENITLKLDIRSVPDVADRLVMFSPKFGEVWAKGS